MPRRTTAAAQAQLNPRMRRHLEDLGLPSVAEYFRWCAANRFSIRLEKSPDDRDEELEALARDEARAAAHCRFGDSAAKLIEQACAGAVAAKDAKQFHVQSFCRAIEESDPTPAARESLRALMLAVDDSADFLFASTTFGGRGYVDGLIKLNDRREQWIAPLQRWRPDSRDLARQFSSLARHLLARFSVPDFMDQAWFRTEPGAHKFRDWFIHLGAGKNIRTAKTPIPMTRLMAHHFLEAPRPYSIEGAIRWGQVHALGGDALLTEAVLGSRIGEDFANDEFWTAVIRFFIANPMLDRRHVAPVADFLHERKFAAREVVTGPGLVETRPPPQPNLSMRGRTAESLLAQVERWHEELGRAEGPETLFFKRSGINGFELAAGREGKDPWTIRELLSRADLFDESRVMGHCVANYARSRAKGACSIWTMEFRQHGAVEKRLTIEMRNGTIVQARGKQNRLPTESEFDVLVTWARSAGLTIGSYVSAAE